MKIFIIESPSPEDLLTSRNESTSLENVCRMFNHQITSFTAYSLDDFKKTIKYISSIELSKENKKD